MATDISICNSAVLLCGADEFTSFSDDVREAKLCNALYPDTRDAMIQSYPWFWSLVQTDLGGPTVATPLYGYKNSYQLPGNTLRVIELDGHYPYKRIGDKLFTDSNTAKVTLQLRPDASAFPNYFVVALRFELASIMATALLEDANKQQQFFELARIKAAAARNIDSQQSTDQQIPFVNFNLLTVRG